MGRIALKDNWDQSIKYANGSLEADRDQGYFVGREREVQLLSNDIVRKNEGSILIRGHPGVGKSSLVLKALNETDDDNLLPVFLSGPDMDENDSLTPGSMMRHLARRLYVYTEHHDLGEVNNLIETFYYKAVSESRDIWTTEEVNVSEHETETEREFSISLSTKSKTIKYVVYLLPFIVGGIISLLPSVRLIPWFPLIATLILIVPTHFLYTTYSREREQRTVSERAKSLYEKDNTLGNLKFDLNRIHRELGDKRIVYVIDEMDKVEINEAQETLEFFKDFFTSSNALFIFVGGEDFRPERFMENYEKDLHRPRSYTYFHSQYFIARPEKEELFRYLDEIMVLDDVTEDEVATIRAAVCFDAKNDYFDVKKEIKERIVDFDGAMPIVKSRKDDLKKSYWYSAVTAFEEKYSAKPSKWEENEEIARELFDITDSIFNGYVGQEINDPEGDTVLDRLRRDFHHFLYRHGILDVKNTESEMIGNLDIPISTYTIYQTYFDYAPSSITEPTEFEREFTEKFGGLCAYYLPLVNLQRKSTGDDEIALEILLNNPLPQIRRLKEIGVDTSDQIKEHNDWYGRIEDGDTEGLERAEVERLSEALDSRIKNFKENQFPQAFAKVYQKICRDEKADIKKFQEINNIFDSGIQNYFNGQNPWVVYRDSDINRPLRTVVFTSAEISPPIEIRNTLKNSNNVKIVNVSPNSKDIPSILCIDTENPEIFHASVAQTVDQLQEYFYSGLIREVERVLSRGTVTGAKNRIDITDPELVEYAFNFERENQHRITLLNWLGKEKAGSA